MFKEDPSTSNISSNLEIEDVEREEINPLITSSVRKHDIDTGKNFH